VAPLALGRLLVEAEDVAPPALAATEDDLLGAQAGRDVGVAAGMARDLVADLGDPEPSGLDSLARQLPRRRP
jgi:hypothetical protein